MRAPFPSFLFFATLSLFLCLLGGVYGGPSPTYEFFPKAYCETVPDLTTKFNQKLTETLCYERSWQATHLAKINVPGEGDIYRLASNDGGHWSLDLSPDVIKVGGHTIALRMPNKQDRDDVKDIAYGIMTYDVARQPKGILTSGQYHPMFPVDPHDSDAGAIKKAASMGSGNNLEHLPGVKPSPKHIKHGHGHVVIGLVPKARNDLGGGTRRGTVWEPNSVGGFSASHNQEIPFEGGFAVSGRNDLPTFAEQAIGYVPPPKPVRPEEKVSAEPPPPEVKEEAPKSEPEPVVASSSGGGSKKQRKKKGGTSTVPTPPPETVSEPPQQSSTVITHTPVVQAPAPSMFWRGMGFLARNLRRGGSWNPVNWVFK